MEPKAYSLQVYTKYLTPSRIKPEETLSLVIYKIDVHLLSVERKIHGYVAWADLVFADNWGIKDLRTSQADISSRAPKIECEPLFKLQRPVDTI